MALLRRSRDAANRLRPASDSDRLAWQIRIVSARHADVIALFTGQRFTFEPQENGAHLVRAA